MCQDRCENQNPELCTARTEPDMNRGEDWFSNDEIKNPAFHNYMKVYVPYCSSDLYAGTKASSEETGNFFFYGKEIIAAVKASLMENFGLSTMETVVLMGGSAGGIGTWENCNDFSGNFTLKCIIDSAGWMPWWFFPSHCQVVAKIMVQMAAMFHGSQDDQKCVDDNVDDPLGILQCGILSTAYPYINHDMFFMENQEDTVYEEQMLLVCPIDNENRTEFLQNLKAAAVAGLRDSPILKPDIGFYYPDCRGHELFFHPRDYLINDGSQDVTLNDAVKAWLDGANDVHLIGKAGEKCPHHSGAESSFRLIF